jgi:hypothetical protein
MVFMQNCIIANLKVVKSNKWRDKKQGLKSLLICIKIYMLMFEFIINIFSMSQHYLLA